MSNFIRPIYADVITYPFHNDDADFANLNSAVRKDALLYKQCWAGNINLLIL